MGALEGVVRIGRQIARNVAVTYQPSRFANERAWSHQYETITDNEGHFAFDRVFPGKGIAARVIVVENGMMQSHAPTNPVQVEVLRGKTSQAQIGGKGRLVVGRVDTGGRIRTGTMLGAFIRNRRVPDQFSDYYSFKVEPDGSFRIDDVRLGKYALDLRITEPMPFRGTFTTAPLRPGVPVGTVNLDFSVPEMPDGQNDEPLELGGIKATFLKP